MEGIDWKFISKELNIKPSYIPPVKQEKRNIGPKKRKDTKDEKDKLLTTNFIWKAQYLEWLANMVFVKSQWEVADAH